MDGMFIIGLLALIVGIGGAVLRFIARPKPDSEGYMPRLSSDERGFLAFLSTVGVGGFIIGIVFMVLASISIIQTGQAGVVRVMGVVQSEVLEEGLNGVKPWATVTRQETRGFQINQTGDNVMEVLTGKGTKFTVELGIPVKLNPMAVALVESRIEDGDWKGEVTSLARGIVRTNIASYRTFADFQARRSAVPGEEVIVREATDDIPAVVRTWDIAYGEELARQIEARVNGLFCDTYGICDIEAVDIGEVVIRKVNPPAAITSEAAALDAAVLAEQTERALNRVEDIRALRREAEGTGYGNLFAFLPDGATLSADDAANFLRAAADKTRADADAYMQRALAEAIADAMSKGLPLPSVIVSTGGDSPTPIFDPRGSQ